MVVSITRRTGKQKAQPKNKEALIKEIPEIPKIPDSKLRRARKAREFTVAYLAGLVGIAHATLTNYETGKSTPSEHVFNKLKLVLKLTGKYRDYFKTDTRKHSPGRKRLYSDSDRCKKPGCTKKPTSNGYCQTHYVNLWRKEQKNQQKVKQEQALKTEEKLTKALKQLREIGRVP
jgi:transcriptional regulator with XRE-family HTH domain